MSHLTFDPDRVKALNEFIVERECIRVKKESGQPWPWTENPIFREYKFCNVRRQDDKTTRWIHNNWSLPHADDPDLWFALVIARRALNWPASMEALGYPVPWNPHNFLSVMNKRASMGLKCFDTAYQLLVQGQKGDKTENMIKLILNLLWEARDELRPKPDDTLRSFFDRLSSFKYMGLFYSGQVVADLKEVQLREAHDWWTFAVPGPGSERGLNRVLGRDKSTPWREKDWREALDQLHPLIKVPATVGRLDGQNENNCLCEFDKYERISRGEGRVRSYRSNAYILSSKSN